MNTTSSFANPNIPTKVTAANQPEVGKLSPESKLTSTEETYFRSNMLSAIGNALTPNKTSEPSMHGCLSPCYSAHY